MTTPNKGTAPAKPKWAGKLTNTEVVKPTSEYEHIKDELLGFVHAAYEQWQKDKNTWQLIHFDSAEEADSAAAGAKWACDNREAGPLTFSRKTTPDPKALMFRVRDKVVRKRKGQPASDTNDTADSGNGTVDNDSTSDGNE